MLYIKLLKQNLTKKEINYGFEWKEKPVFYFHMATEGHLISLLRRNPKVAVSIYE